MSGSLGTTFCLHHAELVARLRTIEAFRQEWTRGGWTLAVDRGWRAQWAALHYLAILGADVMASIASSEVERGWVEEFAPRRDELFVAYEAHSRALDFSLVDP